MKKLEYNLNEREDKDAPHLFGRLDGVTYFCCYYCRQPIVEERSLYLWQKDKNGKQYNVVYVHYECQELFEKKYKGTWFSEDVRSFRMIPFNERT